MTALEACAQAFDNGRRQGDAEGYARGKAEAFAEAGDLISRKALLDVIAETAEGLADCDQQNAAWALRKYAVRDMQTAPAVVAQPVKRGRWFFGTSNHCEWMKCSECYHSQTPTGVFVYCPNCGARMDGDG